MKKKKSKSEEILRTGGALDSPIGREIVREMAASVTLANGTRLGRYEILGVLGSGGMAEVYRARDSKLGRDVAIKVISEQLARDPDFLRRFEREARAVAALSHPNILSIHDFGREGDASYAVTELLEGETLRELLDVGALERTTAVDYALQIASGLGAAHEQKIIHRDLKPENIFVTRDGRIKILDFGVAKVATHEADVDSGALTLTRATSPGTVMGTVGYMSPEQVRAEDADHRSDIFSFGCVLYEMLTGRRAFQAETAVETMHAILKEEPPKSSIVPSLRSIVARCLDKRPDKRFESASDLALALQRTRDSGGAVVPNVTEPGLAPSIAVLPFANMSSDPEQDYFCEGIAEDIINALTHIEGLQVAARASAFQFGGKAHDVGRIGEALNVSTVLEGSVRTAGKRIRLTAQLVNVADGYQLWSERYDREIEDIFAIQDEISESIVGALKIKLVGGSDKKSQRHSSDIEAYQAYLKGQHNWYKRERDSLLKAAHFFEQAVEKDPSYVLALVAAGDAYTGLGIYGYPPEEAATKSKAALTKALAIDDGLAEAHAAMGLSRFYFDWDWEKSEHEYERALELNPGYVNTYSWYAILLAATGRFDGAFAMGRQGQELDPLSPYAIASAGIPYYAAGRHHEAIVEFEKAREIESDFLMAHYFLGGAYGATGRHEESIAILERAVMLSDRTSTHLATLGWAYGAASRRADAERVLRELEERAQQEYVAPIDMAMIWSGLGDDDKCLVWLEESYRGRDPMMVWLRFPMFDHVRSDARFHDFMHRMNLGS